MKESDLKFSHSPLFQPSLFIYLTEYKTTNAFKQRFSKTVSCNAHLWVSSHLKLERHRVLGQHEGRGMALAGFHSGTARKNFRCDLLAHFMTYFVKSVLRPEEVLTTVDHNA